MYKCKKLFSLRLTAVLIAAVFLAACCCVSPSVAFASPQYEFIYADNQSKNYPTSKAARLFAKLVKEKSGGRIAIRIYDGAKLGDEKTVVEKLKNGEVGFARVSLSSLTEYAADLEVLSLPYLYRDAAHMWRVLDGETGGKLLTQMNGSGIVGLSWYDGGVRSFYTANNPIKRPEDLRGLRIRVQESAIMMDTISSFGATPVSLIYDDVYDAIKTGRVDGAENSLPSYVSKKHYEVAKYYCRDEHTRVPEMQIASQSILDRLSAEDSKLIMECASISAVYEHEKWAKEEKKALEKAKKKGVVFVDLTDKERAAFATITAPFRAQLTASQKEILERIDNEG